MVYKIKKITQSVKNTSSDNQSRSCTVDESPLANALFQHIRKYYGDRNSIDGVLTNGQPQQEAASADNR